MVNLCCLLATIGSPAEAQNSCHLRELDLCAATMLVFTQSPGGLATSEQEINKQCVHLREADNCLKNYTRRCMTPIQRELIRLAANSSISLLDEYCTRGSKLRTNYLTHSKCLNQIQKKEQKSCMRDLQASLELLTNNLGAPSSAPSSKAGATANKDTGPHEHGKRLQLACCTYRRFESCLGHQMEVKCGKEALQFVQQVIRRATSRLPETLCRHYKPDGQECKALLPKAGTVLKGPKSGSIISRLLAAYTGL